MAMWISKGTPSCGEEPLLVHEKSRVHAEKKTGAVLRAGLVCFAVGLVLAAAGCGSDEVRSSPDEILTTVKIPDPSVLGYVRVGSAALLGVDFVLNKIGEFGEFFPAGKLFVESLPADMLSKVARLVRHGSHVTLVFLDPNTFGSGAALHFVPKKRGSLVRLLDSDPDYVRTGKKPFEFRKCTEAFPLREILTSLKTWGINLEIPGTDRDQRFLVEEDERGVLVLPCYDARRDLKAFLESTDYLSPWGDAACVVNLDIERLSIAYTSVLRSLDSSLRKKAAMLDVSDRGDHILKMGKQLRIVSATIFGFLAGIDAIRFVSRSPVTGAAELRVLASEGECLDQLFRVLRSDEGDLIGLLPGGLALQLNGDPRAVKRLVRKAAGFYTDAVELDPGTFDTLLEASDQTFSYHAGRYLLGAGVSKEQGWIVSLSTLSGEADWQSMESHEEKTWRSIAGLLGMGIEANLLPGRRKIVHYGISSFNVESGTDRAFHLSTILLGGSGQPGKMTGRLLKLARYGVPRDADLPSRAPLYFRFSLLPIFDLSLPAVEKLLSPELVGCGRIKGKTLTVDFTMH